MYSNSNCCSRRGDLRGRIDEQQVIDDQPGAIDDAMAKKLKSKKLTRAKARAATRKATDAATAAFKSGDASLKFLIQALNYVRAPTAFIQLLLTVALVFGIPVEDLDLVEYFAGMKAVTRAAARAGRAAVGYEIKDNELMDWMSDEGWSFALWLALKLKKCAQSMLAPVCSSWTWMNRHTSGRSIERPLGRPHLKYIKDANTMVSRVALMCLLLTVKGIFWVLEQPKGSLLEYHPRIQMLARHFNLFRVSFPMGNFGGETQKDTWCYSFHSCVMKLPQYATTKFVKANSGIQVVVVKTDKSGKTSVSGGKDLKGTQHYPDGFGEAITNLYLDCKKEIEADYAAFRSEVENNGKLRNLWEAAAGRDQLWHDARLLRVLRHLQK